MARQQLGRIDDTLIARVDTEAKRRGQTRRVFTERALEAALSGQGSGHTPAVTSPQRSGTTKETAPTETSASPRASDRASRTIPDRTEAFRQATTRKTTT